LNLRRSTADDGCEEAGVSNDPTWRFPGATPQNDLRQIIREATALRSQYVSRYKNEPEKVAYDFPVIVQQAAAMWLRVYWPRDIKGDYLPLFKQLGGKERETWGELFKRVGRELGVDPYGLAAYCIFESYNSKTGSFNAHHKDSTAIGVGSTQVGENDTAAGKRVPGLAHFLPWSAQAAVMQLRAMPEFSVRFLAKEFLDRSREGQLNQNLAEVLPAVAYPAWGNPTRVRGNYGNRNDYVRAARLLYEAFVRADGLRVCPNRHG
jgi:hypothetical protein